ncbi:site-specific integrase [Actinophytocola sp.]|uniref:site-specific integrase n=1 Tax=Actinophytocola sp. TaxID=1872138 RepID=UPI0039C8A9B7
MWTEARVALWRATGERPQLAVWTAEHTAQFLHSIRDHRLYPLFHLVALLGLRRGEVLGLRWSDIDLKARTLVVSHQVQEHNGRRVICPPKSLTSLRTLALDHGTVAVLRRLSAESGPASGGGDFLFAKPSGEPLSPGYVTHMFRRLVTECDLPPVRFHDLRHGAASLSLAAGNDLKTVQALLGHDSIVLTADTYTSVLPCLAHQAAEASAALVLKAVRKVSRPRRGRSKTSARNQAATRPRPRTSVASRDRILEPTSDSHGTHTRSTPTGKIPTIKETCWSASIQWVCAARDSNPEPAG